MELTLNLFWLLLTVPALLLWRREGLGCRQSHRSWLVLPALGCLLILLFPVISASDDLCAMRVEAVDPSQGDRLRDASAGRSSHSADRGNALYLLPQAQFIVSLGNLVWSATVPAPAPKAGLRLVTTRTERAPPVRFLG